MEPLENDGMNNSLHTGLSGHAMYFTREKKEISVI
jgi:hypothetical protein